MGTIMHKGVNYGGGGLSPETEEKINEIDEKLTQTPVEMGEETLSTIDDKLNYILQNSGGEKPKLFKSKIIDVVVGSSSGFNGITETKTYDIKQFSENYKDFTIDNFIIDLSVSIGVWAQATGVNRTGHSYIKPKEYDAVNGILTVIYTGGYYFTGSIYLLTLE